MNPSKDQLRREAIARRDRIDPSAEEIASITSHFFNAVRPERGQSIALYCVKGRELDPAPLRDALLDKGFTCLLPIVNTESRVLRFVRWQKGDPLERGPFGILQPASNETVRPDIMVMPLLAFDAQGNRLGYGGGYYDATLQALKPVLSVGLAYDQQRTDRLPTEEHDRKMNWVVTPSGAIKFDL